MRHWARVLPFEELLTALTAEVAAGRVATTTDGPLVLYKYTQRCVFERQWTAVALLARGLILDMDRRTVVATPFPKFFNYGEGSAPGEPMEPLPNEPFEVTEKVDGSLGIVFHDGHDWRVATRGSFKSEQAAWASNWLYSECRREELIPGWTYLVEVVYSANRIVVPYKLEGLFLLGAYDADGYEADGALLGEAAAEVGFLRPKVHRFASLDALIDAAKQLTRFHEGFVVRFASGRRIKVKGDEYCRLHRLVSRVTPLGVYDILVAGDDPLIVTRELPEEFRRDFETIYGLLDEKLRAHLFQIRMAHAATESMDDKALGLYLRDQKDWPVDVARWIFPSRKKGFLVEAQKGGTEFRKKACEAIRPTGNKLDGYTPSSAMNRFQVEAS